MSRPQKFFDRRLHAGRMVATGTLCLATTLPAFGQQSELQEVQYQNEIVVFGARDPDTATAAKTDTPIIETPQTISITTAEQIAAQGAQTTLEALQYTPGVVDIYGGTFPNDAVYLRGFEAVKFIDGLRQHSGIRGGRAQVRIEPYSLERVEVLKGPASVLYGQSAPGGIVNQVRKRPTAQPFGEVLLQAGRYDRLQGAVDLSGPIDEDADFRYRLIGVYRDSGTQQVALDDDRTFISPAISFQPTDATNVLLVGQYLKDRTGYAALPAIGTLLPNVNGQLPRSTNLHRDDFDRYNREQYIAGYLLEHEFNDSVTLRQNVQYADMEMDHRVSFISRFQNDPLQPGYQRTMRRNLWQLRDDISSFGADTHLQMRFAGEQVEHTLLAGVDYLNLKADATFGATLEGTFDIYDDEAIARAPNPVDTPDQKSDRDQVGVYGQYQLKAGGLVLLVGGRHDSVDGELYDFGFRTTTPVDESAFTWRAGSVYIFDNGLAPFVSYSTSFEPVEGSRLGVPYEPTEGEQVEVGVRWQPLGSNTYVALSAFELTQSNVLTTDPNPPPTDPFAQIQTGELRVRGAELEARARPVDAFDVLLAYAYSDSEVTKTNVANQLGNSFSGIPQHQGSLWGNYQFQSGVLRGFGFSAGVRYVGDFSGDLNNTIRVPSHTLIDASVSLDLGALSESLEGAKVRVNATNLTDKTYVASCFAMTGGNCYYGPARQILGTISFQW